MDIVIRWAVLAKFIWLWIVILKDAELVDHSYSFSASTMFFLFPLLLYTIRLKGKYKDDKQYSNIRLIIQIVLQENDKSFVSNITVDNWYICSKIKTLDI